MLHGYLNNKATLDNLTQKICGIFSKRLDFKAQKEYNKRAEIRHVVN